MHRCLFLKISKCSNACFTLCFLTGYHKLCSDSLVPWSNCLLAACRTTFVAQNVLIKCSALAAPQISITTHFTSRFLSKTSNSFYYICSRPHSALAAPQITLKTQFTSRVLNKISEFSLYLLQPSLNFLSKPFCNKL